MTSSKSDADEAGHDRQDRLSTARLILDIRAGRVRPDPDLFAGRHFRSRTIAALFWASHRGNPNGPHYLGGKIAEDLLLTPPKGLAGQVHVACEIDGDLRIINQSDGIHSLIVAAKVKGSLFMGVPIRESLTVSGEYRDLALKGTVGRSIDLSNNLVVARNAVVSVYCESVTFAGEVGHDLRIRYGTKRVYVNGRIGRDLLTEADVDGTVELHGSVGGDLVVTGSASRIAINEIRVGGRTTITPRLANGPTLLATVRNSSFSDEVFIGDNVNITSCDFRQCAGLERFALVGGQLFGGRHFKLANPPSTANEGAAADPVPLHELATIYRQLRTNLERRGNRPAAGAFYYGEMLARLRACPPWKSGEWYVLTLYRSLSGFGLKASPPAIWFLGCSLAGAVGFQMRGFDLDPGHRVEAASAVEAWTFTVKSMLSFLSPPTADLGVGGEWLQIVLRFVGPLLVAQVLLATRERVAR